MIDIRQRDIITLGDDRKFMVLSSTEYNQEKYYYLVNNDNQEVTAMFVKLESEAFREIEDEATLKIIVPPLKDNAMQLLTELKIEMISQED